MKCTGTQAEPKIQPKANTEGYELALSFKSCQCRSEASCMTFRAEAPTHTNNALKSIERQDLNLKKKKEKKLCLSNVSELQK